MSWWNRWRKRDEDLDEEIRAHLAMSAADREARGEAAGEARRNARRELGNELLVREVTRDMWGWTDLERLAQDLKYAFRQMARTPGFTAIAILTLALGLGATTAMFSIVNGVLLQPLKFHDPNHLYLANTVAPGLGRDLPVNARHFHEWRNGCRSCQDVSLFQTLDLTLVGVGEPVRLPALGVSFNFFRTLGVEPRMGRDFLPEEEPHMGQVILTDDLWRSRFRGDAGLVGRDIQLNGEPHTVIGILPPGLRLPKGQEWGFQGQSPTPLIFRPLGFQPSRAHPEGNLNYGSLIRLKPGVEAAGAAAELTALLADFIREYKLQGRIGLTSLHQRVIGSARTALWLLLGAVGAVLLIVCVNVGNLMLVRTAERYREAGVRLALGASRSRLFGMVLTEALLLVSIGGSLGLGFGYAGLKAFVAAAPLGLPRIDEVGMDWRVLAFAAVAIAFSTVACGLFPAWRLATIEPQESLKAAAGATEGGRKLHLREILVGLEVALSTVLLISGGLLMLSFFRLMRVERGFETAHVITQDVSFLSPKYSHGVRRQFLEDLVTTLAAVPGVRAVGATSHLPLGGEEWVSGLRDTDDPTRPSVDSAIANFRFVTSGYWKALGIPLKQGRYLEDSDRGLARAVISERAAQYLWPNRNPLGRHVRGAGPDKPALEVVGVVGEVRQAGLDHDPPMMVYEHFWRIQPIAMSFALRTYGDPRAVVGAIRTVLSSADPEMAISPARTMEQIVEESVAARRFEMSLAVAFGLAALLLASLGIYGVISFTVARRTPEMGIRIALGAGGGQLLAMVLRQGMRPVMLGLAAGVAASLAAGRWIASELYRVEAHDPATIAAVVLILAAVALAACWAPARRATRIDPLRALRFE